MNGSECIPLLNVSGCHMKFFPTVHRFMRMMLNVVFEGPVYRTDKRLRTELNQHMVQSIFWLRLPTFGTSPVASCLNLRILENRSKTSCNQSQPVFSQYIKYYRCT